MQIGGRDAELVRALLGERPPRADHRVALLGEVGILHDARTVEPGAVQSHDRLGVGMQVAREPDGLPGDLEVLGQRQLEERFGAFAVAGAWPAIALGPAVVVMGDGQTKALQRAARRLGDRIEQRAGEHAVIGLAHQLPPLAGPTADHAADDSRRIDCRA